ncbi:MAG: GEVED domain-containing protein [Actinomycetota bacterium]|nr:GEVED domain-containing protein [Actinomycetota bacterium]
MLATTVAASVVVAGPGLGPASAADPLECGTIYSLQGASPRNLRSVDTSTGTMTNVGSFSISSTTGSLNGLGISADGGSAIGVFPAASNVKEIYRLTRSNDTTTLLGAGVTVSATMTHGAINPATGIYYYGGFVGAGTSSDPREIRIYGFNPATSTSLGLVASGQVPAAGGSGDWAFDPQGRLYVIGGDVGNNVLSVIDQALPTTETSITVTGTELATITANEAINGIAFGGDGFLYLASGARIFKANPTTGSIVNDQPLSPTGSVDLASCAAPSTVEIRKNFPDGRANPGDQVTVTVTGGGVPAGTTGTTAGSDTGIQGDPAETAGPVLALTGTTYTISESGAGTGADYTSSWECVNQNTGTAIASGTGTGGSFTMPDGGADGVAALCTFTNIAAPDPLDGGDAPSSYGTTNASNGASHNVPGYTATTNTAPLMLGARIDVEDDGVPGLAADGDDAAGTDDEDGLAAPIVITAGEPTTLSVSVTNDTPQPATLAGWIDLDDDGTLEAGERVTRAIEPASGAAAYDLTFSASTAPGDGYARFRLFPGNLVDPLPTGAAEAGEVEDHPTTFDAGDPIIGGCSDLVTFDSDNESWRAATVSGSNGKDVALQPQSVEWGANAGNPGGAVIEDDLQGGTFTELWTPALLVNGYATDYTPLIGETLQFDYRNTTGIGINVYMGVVGPNGEFYWFNFRSQITNSQAWNRIRVPMDAAQWRTTWTSGLGPNQNSAAPTAAQFQAALGNVDRFTFSIEGQSGPDRTAFDNFGQLCSDFGDAPNSYGTEIGGESPSHGQDDSLPALRLGDTVDNEDAGQPGTGADLDDLNGTDDEDGVAAAIVMTTGDTTSVDVVATNATAGPATLAGWLDVDGDGIFEAAERVTAQVPAGPDSATFTLAFPAGTTTDDTYARFRLFPGIVADPGPAGPSSRGEVEDYPVTVQHRDLVLTKTSDATADSRPGDIVTYTVTATNQGDADFTVDNPAVVVDDLSDVLDDAGYNSNAAADVGNDPTYAAPRLTWEGALGAGGTVTITYTATLKGGGDGTVRNVAWSPPGGQPPGPTPDCADPSTTVPCAEEQYELPKLTLRKSSNRTELSADGQQLIYTVVVKNEGPGDYTASDPATLTDDLSEVLDDATFDAGSITATVGDATFDTPNLSWTGVLAAGDSATITYSVTYHEGTGDAQVDNSACIPEDEALDPATACTTVRVPGSGLEQTKRSDPPSGTAVDVGDEIIYTLEFTNTGRAAATVDTVDNLAGVLDDAELIAGPTADVGLTASPPLGGQIKITGAVPVGESLRVTYTVRVRAIADQGDQVLRNALACQPGDPPSCVPETTEHPTRALAIIKTSNATEDSRPGDAVTYTVTAENTGAGDYTADDPARVVDDLTGVIDDAIYNGDANADVGDDPVYAEPRLTWQGALPAGATVTISYTVQLAGGGDGDLLNVAWAPAPGGPPGPTPDCDDPATTVPCAVEQYELPRLTISKTALPAEVNAVGTEVTYTVVVTNEGPGDYTATAPARFSDDLTEVLDDATFVAGSVTAPAGTTASFSDPTLSWNGVLAAGEDATITYKVRYTGAGDHSLANAACVRDVEAVDPDESCATVVTPGSGLAQTKTANPPSGSSVGAGDKVTYTLTFTNTGQAPATVDTYDELSGVLDDADLTAGPTAAAGLTAAVSGSRINVTGTVPAGETLTVNYTVTVEPYAEQGDHVLRNSLACQPGDPATCEPKTTEHQIGHLAVTKTSDAQAGIDTGDEVTYTITVLNDGATIEDPAVVLDDLSDVLDDATYGAASADRGTATFDDPNLTWRGRLEPGQKATITYHVIVTNQGDHDLGNIASVPGCDEPGCNPAPVVTDLPYVVPSKTTDPSSGEAVQSGDVVTYTLSWTNDGKARGRVDATDDLSAVLDDADLTGEPVSSSAAVTATRTSTTTLRIEGTIEPGQTVTVTYEVTIKSEGARGDNRMSNVLTPDVPQVHCDAAAACKPVDPPVTEHPIGRLVDWKTVDPRNGSVVTTGDEVTFTLHFANTGAGDVVVDREDDLGGVLDDARLISRPAASHPALTMSGVRGGRFSIAGTLAPGQTVTVTYTVRVMSEGNRGDHDLGNFLVDPGVKPPATCKIGTAARGDCTENPVSTIDGTKTVAGGGAVVDAGDRLTYTLTFTNTGTRPGKVDYVDHMRDVVDDADLVSGPTSSAAALQATPSGRRIRVVGTLARGQTVRVTYTVEVKDHAQQGNHRLVNFLAPSDAELPRRCPVSSDTCTTNGLSPNHAGNDDPGTSPNDGGLPDTGATLGTGIVGAALLCLLAGAALVVAGRRRGRSDGQAG